jgi:excisionase family DNA binding protein
MANLTERDGAACREEEIRAILAKPYWTYEEGAIVLGVTTKTLRNMKWRREISFTKFGRRVYISRDLVMKELRQNMVLCPATALRPSRAKAEGDGTGRP